METAVPPPPCPLPRGEAVSADQKESRCDAAGSTHAVIRIVLAASQEIVERFGFWFWRRHAESVNRRGVAMQAGLPAHLGQRWIGGFLDAWIVGKWEMEGTGWPQKGTKGHKTKGSADRNILDKKMGRTRFQPKNPKR